MLFLAKKLNQLSFSKLMAVYAEGNLENGRQFWPELGENEQMLRAEQAFYRYLQEDFFKTSGAVYAIWMEGDAYVSALRLEPYRDGLLLEALETAPDKRGRGYAKQLVAAAIADAQKVYSHVGKRNAPSLRVHEACGFRRISEQAVYIDGSVDSHCYTLCYEK